MHRPPSRVLAALLASVLAPTARAGDGWLPVVDDNSGTFSMQVPIAVPDGPGGSTPDLSLVYSSAGGSGSAGMGWELPYSSIRLDHRWGVPWYWHGERDECDRYALNGRLFLDDAELVPDDFDPLLGVSEDGRPGRRDEPLCTFRTRPDSFVLIRPVFADGDAGQPHGFVVFKPDGTSWWYGDRDPEEGLYRIRSDAHDLGQHAGDGHAFVPSITTRWLLHSVMDRDDNTVRFWPDRRPDGLASVPSDPSDRGGCDGCLRAVTWGPRVRLDPKAPSPPGPAPSPFSTYNGGGVTGAFRQALREPARWWPPQEPSHAFFALMDWEPRPDRRVSYATGGQRVADRRLRQVAVGVHPASVRQQGLRVAVDLSGATVLRTYRLDYDAGTTARSRLRRVWELPGAYDPSGAYAAFGIPFQGTEPWDPATHSGGDLPNPWEFVYSDSATLAGEGDAFALPDEPVVMGVDGSTAAGWDPTP